MAFLDLQPDAYGLSEPLGHDLKRIDDLLGRVLRSQGGASSCARRSGRRPAPTPDGVARLPRLPSDAA